MHGGCCAWSSCRPPCMACMEAAAHAERPMQEDTCMQGYLGFFSIAINDF